MKQLDEMNQAVLDEVNLRTRLRQAVGEDYVDLNKCIQAACNTAADLKKKCEQLEAEGEAASCHVTAFCTKPEEIIVANVKTLAEKYSTIMPNMNIKELVQKMGNACLKEYGNGEPFNALHLETVAINMMPELRCAARTKLLSDGALVLQSLDAARNKVLWLNKPVSTSRRDHVSSYRFSYDVKRFEAAVAVILGNAEPLAVKSILVDTMLPDSLAGGCVIPLAGKRKEQTFIELRVWRDRGEAAFDSLDDAKLVMQELLTAAQAQKVIDQKEHEKWLREHPQTVGRSRFW